MAKMRIRAFKSKETAQANFNLVDENGYTDGILIKSPLSGTYRVEDGEPVEMGGRNNLYFVISFPKGTGLQIDTNSEAPEDVPATPTAEPSV